jgi:hypothetical protein
MNLIELPGIKHVMRMALPNIKYHAKIYIDPVIMPITIEK